MSRSGAETILVEDAASLERAAQRAAAVLTRGGLVLHPTETVYGLGGDGSEDSNRWIARIKGREVEQPLLLLTPDVAVLRSKFPDLLWPEEADALASRFWPGPLTLVLPVGRATRGLVGPEGGLAVRVSPDPVVAAILQRWGGPMTSTSANRTGQPPPRSLGEAGAALRAADEAGVDLLAIDAGPREDGRASTIVSLMGSEAKLLREGPISRRALRAVVEHLQ